MTFPAKIRNENRNIFFGKIIVKRGEKRSCDFIENIIVIQERRLQILRLYI